MDDLDLQKRFTAISEIAHFVFAGTLLLAFGVDDSRCVAHGAMRLLSKVRVRKNGPN